MSTHYSTQVREIGPEAASFASQGMIVLFGSEAPPELREFCYIIDQNSYEGGLEAGQTLEIDGTGFLVTAVGDVALKNLADLGHVTLNFDGSSRAKLSGTIYLSAPDGLALPQMETGSKITIRD